MLHRAAGLRKLKPAAPLLGLGENSDDLRVQVRNDVHVASVGARVPVNQSQESMRFCVMQDQELPAELQTSLCFDLESLKSSHCVCVCVCLCVHTCIYVFVTVFVCMHAHLCMCV